MTTATMTPKTGTKRRKIFLVDDHPIVRRGLAELINAETDLKVCGESESAEAAVSSIQSSHPDLVIADITLPGADGIDMIRFLRKAGLKTPVLVLTMHEEDDHAERALRAGARGFIMKYRAMIDLLTAIRCVLAGRLYLSAELAERLLNHTLGSSRKKAGGIEGLSARELQVLELLGKGEGTRSVAGRLRLSVKTVETYRAKIKEKLKLTSAAQLVRRAVQWVERKSEGGPRRASARSGTPS